MDKDAFSIGIRDGLALLAEREAERISAVTRAVLEEQLRDALSKPVPLSTWRALTSGHLHVVEQVEEAGRQWIVLAPCTPAPDASRALTPIEARIAGMAGRAYTNKEIGAAMRMSQSAAENHLSRAMRKIGVEDRLALVTLYSQLE